MIHLPATLRSALFGLAALGAVAVFVAVVPQTYPIGDWLIWRYLQIWAWAALFCASNLCHGYFWLERVFKLNDRPLLETLVLSLAIGIAGYGLVFHVVGALGLLRWVFPIAYSLATLALGLRPLFERLRSEQRRQVPPPPHSFWTRSIVAVAQVAGVAGVVLIYLTIMTPDAIGYDGAWEHQVIAQEYARNGRIVAFPADYVKNHPQLASVVYAWGYLCPGFDDPQRWAAALHIEFALLLWTLAGVAAAVQAVLDDERLPGAWSGFFLFPAILVYDCNLQGSADHILAFFAAPAYLAALRAARSLSVRDMALTGAIVGTALHIKYQAIYIAGAVAVPLGLAWLGELSRRVRRRPDTLTYSALLRLPLVVAGAALLVASPHFIRNAWFHGNPVYPFMQHVFPSHPTFPGANYWVSRVHGDWHFRPHGSFWERTKSTLEVLVTFSWTPHYSGWSNHVPIFGALFTLCTPLALLLPAPRRHVWSVMFAGLVALTIWAATYRIDRNLQSIVPLLAVGTVAVIVRGYRAGKLARVGLLPLVLLELFWSGDKVAITNSHLIERSLGLIRAGYEGRRGDEVWAGFRRQERDVDAALPVDAKVLVHNYALTLGINRPVLFDWSGQQALLFLMGYASTAQLWQAYHDVGVTHLLLVPGGGTVASRGEDVLFAMLLQQAGPGKQFGGLMLHELPAKAPRKSGPIDVLALGLWGYADGLYQVQHMSTHEGLPHKFRYYPAPDEPLPADEEGRRALLAKSSVIYMGPNGAPAPVTDAKETPAPLNRETPLATLIEKSFQHTAHFHGGFRIYLRKAKRKLVPGPAVVP